MLTWLRRVDVADAPDALSHGGSNSPPVTRRSLSSYAEAPADRSGRSGNEWNTTVFQGWATLVPRANRCSWPNGPSSFGSSASGLFERDLLCGPRPDSSPTSTACADACEAFPTASSRKVSCGGAPIDRGRGSRQTECQSQCIASEPWSATSWPPQRAAASFAPRSCAFAGLH